MLNKICCDVLCSVVQLGVLRNDGRELGEAEGYINMYSRKITSPNDDKEARKWGEPARNSGGDCPTGPQQAVYQLWSSNPNSPLDVKVYLDEQQAGDQTLGGRPRLESWSEMTLGTYRIVTVFFLTSLSPSDRDPSAAGPLPKA